MLVRVTVAGSVGIEAGGVHIGEARLGRLSFGGENYSRLADPAHDAAWDRVNNEVDPTRRLDALKAAYEITVEQVPVLPTAPGLSLLVYNSSRLAGVRNDGGPLGPFFDTTAWFCRAGRC